MESPAEETREDTQGSGMPHAALGRPHTVPLDVVQFTWEGALKDTKLENAFRQNFWAEVIKPTRLILGIIATALLSVTIADIAWSSAPQEFLGLSALRLTIASLCFLPFLIYRRPGDAYRLEWAIVGIEVGVFAVIAGATLYPVDGHMVPAVGAVAFTFAIYAFLPIRLYLTTAACIFGGFSQTTAMLYGSPISAHEWLTFAFIFGAANVLGFVATQNSGKLRRRNFLQTRQLEISRDSLAQAQAVYKTLLSTSDAHAELMTLDGTRLAMNQWVSKALGASEDELIGRSVFDDLNTETANGYRERIHKAIQTKRIQRFATSNNGRFYEGAIHPIVNESGEVIAISAHTFDQTEHHNREAALKTAQVEALTAQRLAERAQHAAEAANISKTRFLANMSHELRTPLNAIIGFSEIIKTAMFGQLAPKYVEYAGDIHDSGTYLLALISDILDIAKIEAGHSELNETQFTLNDIIEDAIRIVEPQVRNRAVQKIETNLMEPSLEIYADERAIKQVLINFLTNAIRYGASGGRIAISSNLDHDSIIVRVTDWGPGIPEEDLERIMKPFEQVETNADSSGVGLGLPLAKHLVESHDGTLDIESVVGEQTSVVMRLPSHRTRATLTARKIN